MKRFIAVFLALFLIVPLFSQEGDATKTNNFKSSIKPRIELGYRFGSKANILWGCGVEEVPFNFWKIHFIAGYQLNPHLSIGLGTGFHRSFPHGIFVNWFDDIGIPLFTDIRISFSNNRIIPYLNTGIGYTFSAGIGPDGGSDSWQFHRVGLYLNPSAGVSFQISSKFSLYSDIGYELQRIPVYGTYCEGFTDSSHAICLNFGISF